MFWSVWVAESFITSQIFGSIWNGQKRACTSLVCCGSFPDTLSNSIKLEFNSSQNYTNWKEFKYFGRGLRQPHKFEGTFGWCNILDLSRSCFVCGTTSLRSILEFESNTKLAKMLQNKHLIWFEWGPAEQNLRHCKHRMQYSWHACSTRSNPKGKIRSTNWSFSTKVWNGPAGVLSGPMGRCTFTPGALLLPLISSIPLFSKVEKGNSLAQKKMVWGYFIKASVCCFCSEALRGGICHN